jgi:hypothetical protein
MITAELRNALNTVTEAEAGERWCLRARAPARPDKHGGVAPLAINRNEYGGGYKWSRCLGHYCMAWRWQPTDEPEYGPSRRGFCRLAAR